MSPRHLAFFALPLGVLVPNAPPSGEGQPVVTVQVSVIGEGKPVRVQVAAVPRQAPCDAPGNVRLLDQMMAPGESAFAPSPWPCVCYRQTSGYFRKLDFGPHHVVCWPARPNDPPVLPIVLHAR